MLFWRCLHRKPHQRHRDLRPAILHGIRVRSDDCVWRILLHGAGHVGRFECHNVSTEWHHNDRRHAGAVHVSSDVRGHGVAGTETKARRVGLALVSQLNEDFSPMRERGAFSLLGERNRKPGEGVASVLRNSFTKSRSLGCARDDGVGVWWAYQRLCDPSTIALQFVPFKTTPTLSSRAQPRDLLFVLVFHTN